MDWADYIRAGYGAYNAYRNSEARDNQQQQAQATAAQVREDGVFRPFNTRNNIGSTQFTTRETAARNRELLQFVLANGQSVQPQRDEQGEYFTVDGQRFDLSEGYRQTLDPRFQQMLDGQVLVGQYATQQGAERAMQSPEQLAARRFADYQRMVAPSRGLSLDSVFGQLGENGQLGYRNTASGTNPLVESLAAGFAREDARNYNDFITQEQGLTDTLLNRGRQGAATGGQIEGLLSQYVDQGAALGGRNINTFSGQAAALSNQASQMRTDNTAQNSRDNVGYLNQWLREYQNSNQPRSTAPAPITQSVPSSQGDQQSYDDWYRTGPGGR